MFNQFDGFNVFSGHIRQHFHVVIVTAWQGDLSRAFSEGGVSEKVNFKGL